MFSTRARAFMQGWWGPSVQQQQQWRRRKIRLSAFTSDALSDVGQPNIHLKAFGPS